MVEITKSDELFSYWPEGSLLRAGNELKGPCPFCGGESGEVHWKGIDRFVFYADGKGMYCRYCDKDGRGDNGHGYYHLSTVARRFNLEISPDFHYENPEESENPLSGLWNESAVLQAHLKVDYEFWFREYAWPKALVDIFRLGRGRFFAHQQQDMHLIPMQNLIRFGEAPLKLYYLAGRYRTAEGKKLKERNAGSSKPYLWHYQSLPESKEVAVIEGDTDGITAWYLGFRNFAATFGARTWMPEKAKLLKALGYERVYILSDGDAAGQGLASEVADSLYQIGFNQVFQINWEGRQQDISALFKETQDPLATRLWIDNHLIEPEMRLQLRYQLQKLAQRELPAVLSSIEELRGSGDRSLQAEIDKFLATAEAKRRRGRGLALHLQAPPGAGKTYTLVKTAERIARQIQAAKAKEKAQLQRDLERTVRNQGDPELIENMQAQLARWTETAVAWYGQYKEGWQDLLQVGATPELWYNYEARSEANCQNYKRVQELGEKHHDIGYFCRTSCPFFNQCSETGYWKQEVERKEKPITFFRHQHLMAQHNADYQGLVIIDEFAGHVLDGQPLSFESKHVYAHNPSWELDLGDSNIIEAIDAFATALRMSMAFNVGCKSKDEQYVISGAAFLKVLEKQVKAQGYPSLSDLVSQIDQRLLHLVYQPNFAGNSEREVHLRCIPQAYDAILRELGDYENQRENEYPSCLHLVAGTLEIYAYQKVYTRHKTPMLIADATGLPALYQAMFGREVSVFAPVIRNPNARIEVFKGSDFTKTEIQNEMGHALRDRAKIKTEVIPTLEGGVFDPQQVPMSQELYDSHILQDSMEIVKKLSERHKSLLVVTHKNLREVVESLLLATWPEEEKEKTQGIAFGHYGALRGTNRYEDYEAVVLIGVFRVPYNIVWRKLQMWAFLLGIKEKIPAETVKRKAYYDYISPEGEVQEGEYRSFEHDFADSFVEMIEAGEINQSAARIRPHSSFTPKFVYFFGNRPALQFVNFLNEKKDFLQNEKQLRKHGEVYKYLKNFYLMNRYFPSYRIVQDHFRQSNISGKAPSTAVLKELRLRILRETTTA